MDRAELIDRLISTGHLNVPDRNQLGAIGRQEIHAAVRARFERDGHFPPVSAPETAYVYEGPQIRRLGGGQYLAISQRSDPIRPTLLAETLQQPFADIDALVSWYIDCEWGLIIDGIQIH